jgi:hypothetical protein
MGRVGSCFDNAAAEAFFSSLEWEVLSRNQFHRREVATRYDKYALTYLGGVTLAATITAHRLRLHRHAPINTSHEFLMDCPSYRPGAATS